MRKTVKKCSFLTLEMHITQNLAECCKVPFVSCGPIFAQGRAGV